MACSLCVLVVVLPFVVLVGAMVLRVAVWLSNRVLGQPAADRDYGYAVDDDYHPPWRPTAIPPPDLGKAVWITAAVVLAALATGVGLAFAAESAGGMTKKRLLVGLGSTSLVSVILIQVPVLKLFLPTTFRRACVVTAFVLLLGVPVALAAGGIALVGLNAIAPNMGR